MFIQEGKLRGRTNIDRGLSTANFTNTNLKKLKIALSSFSYLNATGEISDRAFDALVKYACSIFIENEVEFMVQDALERKLMQFFYSRLSSIETEGDFDLSKFLPIE